MILKWIMGDDQFPIATQPVLILSSAKISYTLSAPRTRGSQSVVPHMILLAFSGVCYPLTHGSARSIFLNA